MTPPPFRTRPLNSGSTLRYNQHHVDNDPVPGGGEKSTPAPEYARAGREYPVSVPTTRSRTPPGFLFRSAAMSIDDIKKRFVNEIKLRAYDDKYIDKGEEREILQIAIQLGVGIDSARSALVQVCEENSYILESVILKNVKDQVETAAGNDGKVDQKEFDLIFQNTKRQMQGKKNDRELKKMIITVMEETGNNKVKTGWFSDWYTALKRDLGMA
jgi:hypothetical protein